MYLLKSVDVWSCAKVAGIFYGCAGLLAIPMALIAIAASAASPQPMGVPGAVGVVLLAIFAPLLYGLLGFLLGALSAWLYNVAAKYVGGIRLQVQSEDTIAHPAKGVGLI